MHLARLTKFVVNAYSPLPNDAMCLIKYVCIFFPTIAIVFCLDVSLAQATATEPKLPSVQVIDHSLLPSNWAGEKWPALISGGGDIVIELDSLSFKNEENRLAKYPSKPESDAILKLRGPEIFIGGVPLGDDGKLVSRADDGTVVRLRYRISPSNHSRDFWTTVYKDNQLVDASRMSVALGWGQEERIVLKKEIYVRVSTKPAIISALVVLATLSGFYIWALCGTDIFRIGRIDDFWRTASTLRWQMKWRRWRRLLRRNYGVQVDEVAIAKRLLVPKKAPDAIVLQCKPEEYNAAAKAALSGNPPSTPEAGEVAKIGLALYRTDWRLNRRPYSLARVQIGTWTIFACSVAVFLWVVYGVFPNLEASMFGLLGISTATAMLSYYFEEKSPGGFVAPSEGFITDILTGWDGNQYVHRFQAVIVNFLLLASGAVYVIQNLGYPVFHDSWLHFLGLSGIAQVAGKKLLESKPEGGNIPAPVKVNLDGGGEFKPGRTVD